MAQPITKQSIPGRTLAEFAGREFKPEVTTTAQAPTQIVTPYLPIEIIAFDTQVGSISVGALTAGASSSFTLPIQLKGFPKLIGGEAQNLLQLHTDAYVYHSIAGLVVGSVQLIPIALSKSNGVITGPIFDPTQTYVSWTVKAAITVVAVAATSSGSVNVRVNARLLDQLG